MEPHLFTERPTLGLIVLSVLCILFAWRAAQALRILASPPEREEPLPAQPDFQPPEPRRNRLWDITLCVLTALAGLAVVMAGDWWIGDALDFLSTRLFYLGDLLLAVLALILPLYVKISWNASVDERREGVLGPLFQVSQFGILLPLLFVSSYALSTRLAVITLLALLPLAFFANYSVFKVHGLAASSERWWFIFIPVFHVLCWSWFLEQFDEFSVHPGPQANLHDSMGLVAVIVYAGIYRITVDRAMRRDGDVSPERRISLTGL